MLQKFFGVVPVKIRSALICLVGVVWVSTPVWAAQPGTKVISGAFGLFSSGVGRLDEGDRASSLFLSGLFGLGADFDYFYAPDTSIGGFFRYYNTSDTLGGTEYTQSLATGGGMLRAHLVDTNNWILQAGTGFGFVTASAKSVRAGVSTTVDSGMGLGLYLGLTVLYKISDRLSLGFENLRGLGLGDKLNGWILSDYMFKISYVL